MNRERAWRNYFASGDTNPLVAAYQDSIQYIVYERFAFEDREDMFQWGMIGVLKGIRTLDVKRVKSLDAWIFLNARGMMFNHLPKKYDAASLEENLPDSGFNLGDVLGKDDDYTSIDLIDALKSSCDLSEAREQLESAGYKPMVRIDNQACIELYKAGKISLRGLARELGMSRRQVYKMVEKLPSSW